ncbi:MAG: hypothetical protein ACREQB_09140 [Candidatus Binataceae bacterium]
MTARNLGRAAGWCFGVLLVLNAFVFPLVFPAGPPAPYENARSSPLYTVHTLALVTTALLITLLFAVAHPARRTWVDGLKFGALLGLVVSLPSGMHTYAMVDMSYRDAITPILWTVVTWAAAGAAVGAVSRQS